MLRYMIDINRSKEKTSHEIVPQQIFWFREKKTDTCEKYFVPGIRLLGPGMLCEVPWNCAPVRPVARLVVVILRGNILKLFAGLNDLFSWRQGVLSGRGCSRDTGCLDKRSSSL